jgi:hypothetical protein
MSDENSLMSGSFTLPQVEPRRNDLIQKQRISMVTHLPLKFSDLSGIWTYTTFSKPESVNRFTPCNSWFAGRAGFVQISCCRY